MDSIIKKDKENNSFMLEVILLKWSIIFLLYLGANVVQVTGMINIITNNHKDIYKMKTSSK